MPVDFEAGASWWDLPAEAGFSPAAPAVVASTGVSMYLTRDANAATLRQLAALRARVDDRDDVGLPSELLDEQDRPGLAMAANGARASGTPFISYFSPDEIVALAREAGFADARHVPAAELNDRVLRRPGGRAADVDWRGPAGSDGLTRRGRVSLTP